MENINYDNGINFECQGSSNCCVSRNNYGFVYLSKKDIIKIAKFTELKIEDFIKLYCDETDGFIHFKENNNNNNCIFLQNKKCSIYKARPTQCRTWPFWSENMKAKTWNLEISNFCPGIGKGKLINRNTIEKRIKTDEENEKQMLNEN